MKKIIFACVMLFSALTINAQDLGDILSKVGGVLGGSNNSAITSVVDNIIGTTKVSASSLVGTWNYVQPAVAFETENMFSRVGGAATSAKIESNLATALAKVGIVEGKFSITFAKDGTFTTMIKGKTIKGVYTVNDATITFAKSKTAKTKINANVKLGTTLQVTFKADKLLEFAKQFGDVAAKASSSLSTISALAKNFKGMQVGMRLKK